MTDPTIELDARGEMKMLKVPDPEVKKFWFLYRTMTP